MPKQSRSRFLTYAWNRLRSLGGTAGVKIATPSARNDREGRAQSETGERLEWQSMIGAF